MRSYSAASDLVQLPRLNAQSAARLLQELLNAAKDEKKLPAVIAADRDQLKAVRVTLTTELSKRIVGEGKLPPRVAAADRVEDNAFAAVIDFLKAWERLPVDRHPQAAIAATIREAVAASGLGFLAIAPADEWQEIDLRIEILAKKGYDDAIRKLGGGAFLDELTVAHKAYGEALGITVVKPVVDSPAVGAALAEAIESIREYVLRVSAHVRRANPKTGELAARLLAPLTHWKDRTSGSSEGAEDEAVDTAPPGAEAGEPVAKDEEAAKPVES